MLRVGVRKGTRDEKFISRVSCVVICISTWWAFSCAVSVGLCYMCGLCQLQNC